MGKARVCEQRGRYICTEARVKAGMDATEVDQELQVRSPGIFNNSEIFIELRENQMWLVRASS